MIAFCLVSLSHQPREGNKRHTHMAVGQKWVSILACPGKWNQGLKPAVRFLVLKIFEPRSYKLSLLLVVNLPNEPFVASFKGIV